MFSDADDDKVSLELMVERGLIRNLKRPVKILAQGSLSKKLTVQAHKFSKSAQAGIEAAGGSCEVVTP